MVPWAHPSLHPKQHVDQFCHFCTAHHRVSHYFTTGCYAFPPKVPLPLGGSGSPSNTWYLERTRVINEDDISIGSAIFVWVQMLCCTMHCQWGRKSQNCTLPLKFRHPVGEGPSHSDRQHAQKLVKIVHEVREICSSLR